MQIKPLFSRVILKKLEQKNETKSGIFIPESVGDEPLLAEVVEISDTNFDNEQNKIPMLVKKHDKVLYNKFGATNFKIDGNEYLIINQTDILAVFKEG